jgi:SAM-dependent methyltransferase
MSEVFEDGFSGLARRFAETPLSQWARSDFYDINREFVTFARRNGFSATNRAATNLLKTAHTPEIWEKIKTRNKVNLGMLERVAALEPRTYLDGALESVVNGDLATALKILGRIHTEPVSDFGKYRSIINAGPDKGLAVWQVMNPFYLIWSIFPVARGKTSELWRSEQFDKQKGGEAGDRLILSDNEKSLVSFLRSELGPTLGGRSRVLECGSGFGRNARILVEELGIDPSNYFGFDLHGQRVIATRQVIDKLNMQMPEARNRYNEEQVSEIDILSDEGKRKLASFGTFDIVFYASFSSVFEDAELSRVLETISTLKPKYIVDIAANTSWGLCVGRVELEPFYEKIGFELLAFRFESPHLLGNEAHAIWFPLKYWVNRKIWIFRSG